MSSAILYLAIVAIWACVLIPRWLRRDSARWVPGPDAAEPDADVPDADVPDMETEDGSLEDADEVAAPDGFAGPPAAEEGARRRVLAARRRFLLMLIGLEIAASTLAVLKLAAIWVVAPPSVMLVGYLFLLREAGQADAERAQREAEAAAAARARERERDRRAQARKDTPVEGTPVAGISEAAAALAAKFASAPVPADYEEPGRDFAPGLAGKYTTSNAGADAEQPGPAESADDYHDGYDQPRLRRAVGD